MLAFTVSSKFVRPSSVELTRTDMFPGLLERPLGNSIYELLGKHYETVPDEAVEQIDLINATTDEARILEVPLGSPLLSVTRTTMDTQGRKIEYSHDLFRGDRTRLGVKRLIPAVPKV